MKLMMQESAQRCEKLSACQALQCIRAKTLPTDMLSGLLRLRFNVRRRIQIYAPRMTEPNSTTAMRFFAKSC